MPTRTWKSALLSGRCPRCREGYIFKYPLGKVMRFFHMHKQCVYCNANFEPEPGFYFGAMYISYTLTVAFFVVAGVVLYVFFRPEPWVYSVVTIFGTILSVPIFFRYSRILFLYFFGGLSYDGTLTKQRGH